MKATDKIQPSKPFLKREKMENNGSDFIFGFDYLRVFLCIAVVALHCNVFNVPNMYSAQDPANPLYYRILLYNLFWIAVPSFLTVSLFLYFKKSLNDKHYAKKRILKLFAIYFFWGITLLFINNNGYVIGIIGNVKSFYDVILLLISNYNIAYFLFILLAMTILTELFLLFIRKTRFNKLSVFIIYALFLLSLVTLVFGIFCARIFGSAEFALRLGFSNIFNYIPYLFSVPILYYHLKIKAKQAYDEKTYILKFAFLCLGLWIIFSAADWQLRASNPHFLIHNYESLGRPAVVFAGMCLISSAHLVSRPAPQCIKLLSELTMGVFLTHTVILNYVAANEFEDGTMIFFITLTASFVFSFALKKIKGLV